MTEPCDLSAVVARALIGRKALSPVELLESCIARIDAVNPRLNAVVATDFERARATARRAADAVARGESLGPLHGLPLGIKDLNDTAGLRTTYASPLYADHVPEADEHLVACLRAAGGIVACKTNTPEFGAGANTVNEVYGFTGNPFDPERICGGSSGGSAVALATGMVPLASGSDLGGSLRTPAGYCGVVGYRPTPGLVANPSSEAAWSPLAVDGPMARDVADLRLMLSAMTGPRREDPLSLTAAAANFLPAAPADLSRLRVAVSEDLGFAPVSREIRSLLRERVTRFAGVFGACEDADPALTEAEAVFDVLRGIGFVAAFGETFARRPEAFGPNVRANIELGLKYTASDVARAMAGHTAIFRRFLGFMETHDILICPVAAVPPFGKDRLSIDRVDERPLATYYAWIGITFGLTLTGHPVLALPCGLDRTGTPFGLQVVGRYGRDAELLAIGQALEGVLADDTDCRRPLPDLAALAAG